MSPAPVPLRPAAALTFQGVSLGYGSRVALSDLHGEIADGELLAVVGPNGAGKSTLLRGIVGDCTLLAGRLDLPGRNLRAVAYLPQRPEVDKAFPITVFEFAAMGLWRRLGPFRRVGTREGEAVASALARVGILSLARRPLSALSGGQMQRALFARTMVQDAPVILLDEPFTAVDAGTTADLLGIVLEWHRGGRTVVAALHDLGQVRAHFPRALLLAGRPVAWGPTAEALSAANLERSRRGEELCSHDHGPVADIVGATALGAA